MRVYEALADAFVGEGTSVVFGLMGDANQHWLNVMMRRGACFYDARHEGPGLAMAEGWGSITDTPGVCTTTRGPGMTQLATSMVVASRSKTPLVAFCGDAKVGDGTTNQAFNAARFAAAVECGFVRVASAEMAYDAVRKAFYLARSESCPVMLSAPVDVQWDEFDGDQDYMPSCKPPTNDPFRPGPAAIAAACDAVAASERVVMIVGRGAVRSGAGAAVRAVAERTGGLIANTLMAMNWPHEAGGYHAGISGGYATRTAMELFREADCVIAVGAGLNSYTTQGGSLYPSATVVQFDIRPQVVMGDGRRADCYVQADARQGLEALDALLEARQVLRTGFRTADVKARLARALDDPKEYELDPETVDPREACRVLDAILPSDFGIFIGHGHSSGFPLMLCRTLREYAPERPFTLHNRSFGSIGQTISHAIGAIVATGRPLAMIDGDASFMMHATEFETAVRHGLPLLAVILNDQAIGAEYHKAFVSPGLNPTAARIPTPDLGAVGTALGGRGYLVRTITDLAAGVSRFVTDPKPTVLDVRISSSVESILFRRNNREEEA